MNSKTLLLTIFATLCTTAKLQSQATDTLTSSKTITNTQMVGVGYTQLLDTYLSPEQYTGTETRYLSHTVRQKDSRQWISLILHEGSIATAHNRADNANYMAGHYAFTYGRQRQWTQLDNRLTLRAGAQIQALAGFLYNTRNSNNPAQAQLQLQMSPNAAATYRFGIAGKPCAISYEVAVPLAGIMFSPNYGQSYYEIFSKGNYDHNIVPTTILTTPSLKQMLTLQCTLKHATLTIGYLGDYQQAKVNSLKQHAYTHMVVIGIKRKFKITKLLP